MVIRLWHDDKPCEGKSFALSLVLEPLLLGVLMTVHKTLFPSYALPSRSSWHLNYVLVSKRQAWQLLEPPLKGSFCIFFALFPFFLLLSFFLLTRSALNDSGYIGLWCDLENGGHIQQRNKKKPQCGNLGIKTALLAWCPCRHLHDMEMIYPVYISLTQYWGSANWNNRFHQKQRTKTELSFISPPS